MFAHYFAAKQQNQQIVSKVGFRLVGFLFTGCRFLRCFQAIQIFGVLCPLGIPLALYTKLLRSITASQPKLLDVQVGCVVCFSPIGDNWRTRLRQYLGRDRLMLVRLHLSYTDIYLYVCVYYTCVCVRVCLCVLVMCGLNACYTVFTYVCYDMWLLYVIVGLRYNYSLHVITVATACSTSCGMSSQVWMGGDRKSVV